MKFKDTPIRKKITRTNFMMVGIPVLIVLLLTVGILLGILTGAGSSLTIAAIDKMSGGNVTNYQLQLMVDAINEDLAENPAALEAGSPLREVCAELEKMGAQVMVAENGETRYLSPGAEAEEMDERAGDYGPSVFLRTEEGFLYRAQTNTQNGDFVLTVADDGLLYPQGEMFILEQVKSRLKMILLAVCAAAVIIIVLTGSVLSRRLSRSILVPGGKLKEATQAVHDGNLDRPVGYSSGDELGQVCGEFDEMRRRLLASVQKQKEYARQRQEMVAGISHDLSTPITSIKGYISGILDGVADTPEKREHYLRTVYDTACDMERMVDDLFLLSKLDVGDLPNTMERVELGAFLEDYCGDLKILMRKNGVELVFENRCGGPVFADADRMEMGRVLQNLAENSIKYRKMDEKVKSRVNIVLDEERGAARIVFSDNGTGVAAHETEKIFESFYRGDPARSKKGSGLGLSIARRIVERMGGRISAQGRPGLGLAVTILLPRKERGN